MSNPLIWHNGALRATTDGFWSLTRTAKDPQIPYLPLESVGVPLVNLVRWVSGRGAVSSLRGVQGRVSAFIFISSRPARLDNIRSIV